MRTESPRLLARLAGVSFLLTILGGLIAQGYISNGLINFADPAATANNILAHRQMFEIGFTIFLIEMACQLITTGLLYTLLKPVNHTLARLMLLFEMMAITIKTFARVFYIMPLWVLESPNALNGMEQGHLQHIAMLLLRLDNYGAQTALAFFGFSTLIGGYLVFKSGFLPRWLGVIGMISAFGWLTYIYPPLGRQAFLYASLFALLGSAAKIFWLLVFGVDEEKFRAVEAANSY